VAELRVFNQSRGQMLADRAAIADTSAKRRTGLLKHATLEPGEGLWITPSEGIHTFGMNFAIDVVFLNKRRQVIKVRPNMPKRRISLCLTARSVVELPAGTLQQTGTVVGDTIVLERLTSSRPVPPA
jgi:uncharacterized protein